MADDRGGGSAELLHVVQVSGHNPDSMPSPALATVENISVTALRTTSAAVRDLHRHARILRLLRR